MRKDGEEGNGDDKGICIMGMIKGIYISYW